MTYGGFNWKLNFRWYPVPQREMDRRKGDRTLPVRYVIIFSNEKHVFSQHCYHLYDHIRIHSNTVCSIISHGEAIILAVIPMFLSFMFSYFQNIFIMPFVYNRNVLDLLL